MLHFQKAAFFLKRKKIADFLATLQKLIALCPFGERIVVKILIPVDTLAIRFFLPSQENGKCVCT